MELTPLALYPTGFIRIEEITLHITLKEVKIYACLPMLILASACSPEQAPRLSAPADQIIASPPLEGTFETQEALCHALRDSQISVASLTLTDPTQNSFYLKCIVEFYYGPTDDTTRFDKDLHIADVQTVQAKKTENLKALSGASFDPAYRTEDDLGVIYYLLVSNLPQQPVDAMLTELIDQGFDVNLTLETHTSAATPQRSNQALGAARFTSRQTAIDILEAAGARQPEHSYTNEQAENHDRELCYSLERSDISVSTLPLGDPTDHAFYLNCILRNYAGEHNTTHEEHQSIRERRIENIKLMIDLEFDTAYKYISTYEYHRHPDEPEIRSYEDYPLFQAIIINYIPIDLKEKVITALLMQGADPNYIDLQGYNGLGYITSGRLDSNQQDINRIMAILIAHGATE